MLRRSKPAPGPGLIFDHVSLNKRGPTLALEVPPGSSVALMGVAGSGKSSLLQAISGERDPVRGAISRPGESMNVEEPDWARRDTPMSIAREILGRGSIQRATDALSTLGLWEVRQEACASLSPGLQTAASFLRVILSDPPVITCDHRLDHLDPQVLASLWPVLQEHRRRGTILVYSTYRPDLGERADFVLVLKAGQISFSGTPEALRRTSVETELEVATNNRPGTRALAEPFEVDIEETDVGLRISAKEGQALAAKLLLEGYGDVRYIVQRNPSFSEALAKFL
jgi:ABC-type multidrug transport system ATPase subunit